MLAKKTSKNQLTLPGEIVKKFPDIEYFDVSITDMKIVLTPVVMKPVNENISNIRDKMDKLGISHDDLKDAIKWARKQKK